jgi:hypothetical protein
MASALMAAYLRVAVVMLYYTVIYLRMVNKFFFFFFFSLIRTAYATVLVSSTFKRNTQLVQFLTGNRDCVEVVPCGVRLTRDLPAQV